MMRKEMSQQENPWSGCMLMASTKKRVWGMLKEGRGKRKGSQRIYWVSKRKSGTNCVNVYRGIAED